MGARAGAIASLAVSAGIAFPGAPQTQAGNWDGGSDVCPAAAPNRYLPARSGCVTALRTDVDGDGSTDLVLLYGHLTAQQSGGEYAPSRFTLKVVPARGDTLTATLPQTEANPTIVEYGNVNGSPGAELFIQVMSVSSGSSAMVYSVHGGRLESAGVELSYGGDSGFQAGFTCYAGRVVSHTFVLTAGGEHGRWTETDTTYAWHGPALRRLGSTTSTRAGVPPAVDTRLGVGCGTVTGRGRTALPPD